MSTRALKIRGVPYHDFAEVESAVYELSAQLTLAAGDEDSRDDLARHIGDLLASLPDERSTAILSFINAPWSAVTVATDSEVTSLPDVEQGRSDAEDEPLEDPICPLCAGAGVLAIDPPQDPTATRCDACDGYGRVYTGSRVPDQATRACPICAGRGFRSTTPNAPVERDFIIAAETPEWPGALWNPDTLRWDPPATESPWVGATWNDIRGAWEQ